MNISKTTRFNTCKKIAQLQRVITVFKTQLEDKGFQKLHLGLIYDEKFDKLSKEYEEKLDKDIRPKLGSTDKIENKYKDKYEQNISNLKKQISEKASNIQTNAEKIISELQNLMTQLNSISSPLIEKSKTFIENYNKKADENKKNLESKVKELNLKYNKEVDEFLSNADAKENQFVIDSRAKFEEMRKKQQEAVNALKNSKPLPKLSKKEIENLKKHKQALATISDQYKKLYEAYNFTVNAHRMWIFQAKTKFKDMMKTTTNSTSKVDENTLKKAREDLQKLLEKISQELTDKQKQHELLKAELTFTYQKLKSEIVELLEKENADFLEKKAKLESESGQFSKELSQLKEQNKQELNALKDKYAEEEKFLTEKENQAKAQLDAVSKPFKSEKQKIKKELNALKAQNKAEKSKKENELNSIRENQQQAYKTDENALREQLTLLKRGGNQQENENRKQLNMILQEKEKALIAKTKKINDFAAETSDVIEKLKLRNKLNEESFNHDTNDEYTKLKAEGDSRVNDLAAKYKEEEQNLKDQNTKKYVETINSIKAEFDQKYPPVQEDPEIIALKNQFAEQQQNLQNIKTPSSGNGEFALLNATVETLQSEFAKMKAEIDKERNNILNSWKSQIEAEEKRHNENTNLPSSRNRDQLKNSLKNQLIDVIESREKDEKRLKDILALLNSENDRVSQLYKQELENPSHNNLISTLNHELNNVDEVLDNMIKTANSNKEEAIKELQTRITNLNQKNSLAIEQINLDTHNESEDYKKTLEQLQKDLENAIEKSKLDDKKTSMELSLNVENTHTKNDNEINAIQSQIEKIKIKIQNDKNTNEIIISSTKEQNEKDIDKAEKEFQKDLHKLKCNTAGLLDFLNEKISVLEEELEKLNANFDITKPRECDIERIAFLEKKLTNVTAFLKTQLQEFMQIKSLIVSRESEYNKRFGSGPKVGTFDMPRTPHSAHATRN